MMYLGDYKEDSTVYFCWSTNDKNGASISRDETYHGNVVIYKDNDVDACTVGRVDVMDFDGLTGIHNCKIDLGFHAFYTVGHDYSIVLVGAVLDGETVNAVLATFSIENRFSSSDLIQKAARAIVNKAVQNKSTGAIEYYDDAGSAVILTHTPTDNDTEITRTPS